MLARVLLAQDRPGQALALLDRLAAPRSPRTGPAASSSSARCGRWRCRRPATEPAAVAALAEALTAGLPAGLCPGLRRRGPADGRAAAGLIVGRRLEQPAGAVPLGYLARLTAAFDRAQPAGPPPGRRGAVAAPGLVEPLTARELEVLGLLAAGQPNQGIADQLVVTLDTVKKHVSHVLGKLGAANRTEAVARARELGLLR